MLDFQVWYQGRIIDNIKGETLRKAQNLADRIYGGKNRVVVNAVNDTRDGHDAAKQKSLDLK